MENTVHAPEPSAESAQAPRDGLFDSQSSAVLSRPGESATDPAGVQHTEIVPAFVATPVVATEAGTEPPPLPDHLRQIPFRLELRVPLLRFTLADLQHLKPGDLLLTEQLSVRDLVLTAAGERLLLVELEAIEQQLAARVKRLAWRHKWRRQA